METTLFIASCVFVLAGALFIYLALRNNERFVPEGGLQWATSIFSVLLIVTGAMAIMVLINPPEAPSLPLTEAESARLGELAEDFSFRLVHDDSVETLSSYQGEAVLVNFWATWCGVCREELPDLNRLQEKYEDQGLQIVLISDEERRVLQTFEREVALKPVTGYIDNPRDLPEPFNSVVQGRPLFYLIDADGVIRYYQRGRLNVAEFERAVQPYLQAAVASR